MITIQIPAAIRACSPVVVTGPDGYERAGTVAFMFDGPWVTIPPLLAPTQPGIQMLCGICSPPIALNISDPTGAAHLAWWLLYQTPSRTAEQHAARLEAIGWTAAGYHAAIECAARGVPVGAVGLRLLRDYALRVVSHG